MKLKKKIIISFILSLTCLISISVYSISSANYTIDASITSSGGRNVSSANYSTNTIIGTISGKTNSTNYYNYLGFFYGGGGGSSSQANSCPNITYIYPFASPQPTAGSNTSVTITFIVNDSNGVADINNASANASFSTGSETTRYNTSCVGTGDITNSARNITCTVQMTYYDGPGTWTATFWINDSAATPCQNWTSTTFTYQSLVHLNLTSNTLAWTNIGPNTFNNTATAPINVTNIGNANISNISIKAYELLKDGTSQSYQIGAGNFTVTNLTGSSCIVGYKTALINKTDINLTTNATAYRYTRGPNVTALYYCLDVPAGLATGTYNTSNPWVTTGCC